jgi:N-methylhydantoinase B
MWGQVATALLTTLGYGDLPVNGGLWRPIDVELGEPGTIVNVVAPGPVSNGHVEAGMRACKLARDVLGQGLALSDDPVLRGRVGGKAHDGPPVAGLFGGNQHGTVSVVFYLDNAAGIGGGAQTIGDGQDVYGCTCMTGCGVTDLEAHEAADPLLFLWRSLVENSGGPGQHRGGQGMEQAFALTHVDQMAGPTFTACTEVPASGLAGGFPGAGSTTYIVRETNVETLLGSGRVVLPDRLQGQVETMRNKVGHLIVNRGDVLVIAGGGGGGLGDPLLREPARVAADVSDGYATLEHADAAYGVIVDANGDPDLAATTLRRDEIRRERIGGAPSREITAPPTPGVSIARDSERGWSCSSCGEHLAGNDDDWRGAAVLRETEIAQRYRQLAMRVRPRSEEPRVLMREHYCPSCAAALTIDVVVAPTEVTSVDGQPG